MCSVDFVDQLLRIFYKKRVGNYKKKTKRDNLGKNMGENNEIIWSKRIQFGYLTHCVAKVVLEFIFLSLFFKLQKCQTNGLFKDGSQFWGSWKEGRLFGRTWMSKGFETTFTQFIKNVHS